MSTLPRVGLVQACDDPQLFGASLRLWPKQRELLTAVESGPRTHVWALGRRSGKTTALALIALWDCLLRPELEGMVRRREHRHAVAVATRIRQARLVVDAARAIVLESPLLSPLLVGQTEDELEFANGTVFSAFPVGARGARGWPISSLLLDEAAHLLDSEGNAAAGSVWTALAPSTLQFGGRARLVASSTPWGSEGWFAEMHQRATSGELEDALAQHATTAEANPTIDVRWLEAEERRDPDAFRSEYLAAFSGSGSAHLDPESIDEAVTLPGELRPDDGTNWIAGLDPAFSSDPFGLCLVARARDDQRRLLVGFVRSWQPPRRKVKGLERIRRREDQVLEEVAEVIRLFGAKAVTDTFKSSGVTDRLRRHGVSVRPIPMSPATKDAAFSFLKARLNEGSIDLYEHPGLLRELRAVRTRYAPGRSSVLLPRIAGSHCDLAQALAIACLEHDRHGHARGGRIYSPVDLTLPPIFGIPGEGLSVPARARRLARVGREPTPEEQELAARMGTAMWTPDDDPARAR